MRSHSCERGRGGECGRNNFESWASDGDDTGRQSEEMEREKGGQQLSGLRQATKPEASRSLSLSRISYLIMKHTTCW
jgi:hypothetical protein